MRRSAGIPIQPRAAGGRLQRTATFRWSFSGRKFYNTLRMTVFSFNPDLPDLLDID
jgi:hypothetical protein